MTYQAPCWFSTQYWSLPLAALVLASACGETASFHEGSRPLPAAAAEGSITTADALSSHPIVAETNSTVNEPPVLERTTREMTFFSQILSSASLTAALDPAYLEQEIALLRLYNDQSETTQQITRPSLTDTFEQGHTGSASTEAFEQTANRLVDILIVIDNSNSMSEEQTNLAGKLTPLLEMIADTDWQIGIVTTDPNLPCLRQLVRKSDANYESLFTQGITAGVDGSTNERGVLTAARSLAGSCLAKPWIRPDSTLAVLFVSDEDNCSNGQDCPDKAYASGSYLYDYMASIRQPGQNARIYGIIWHPSLSQEQCPTAKSPANIYAQLINDTSGTWGSICDADYSSTLNAISRDILTVLNSRFTLHYPPVPGSLKAFVNGQEISQGYTVLGKVVRFDPPPPQGASITLTYQHDPLPIHMQFPLREKPTADSLKVAINGQLVASDEYVVDPANQTITFQKAPAERAQIEVTYAFDLPMIQDFTLANSPRPGSLRVFTNGTETQNFTFEEATGKVSFTKTPPESATLQFTYQVAGEKVLSYPFSFSGTAQDLAVYDSQTLTPVQATFAQNQLVLGEKEYVEGRRITVKYPNPYHERLAIELPATPVSSSMVVMSGNVACEYSFDPSNSRMVLIENCNSDTKAAEITLTYNYVAATLQEFTFATNNLPKAEDFQEWTVWVNNQLSTDYVRSGHVFRFKTALPEGAVVRISLKQ